MLSERSGRIRLSRRLFLGCALVAPAWAQTRGSESSAFDLSLLDDWLTPVDLFFVREHFPAPAVSAHGWKLSLDGAVATPLEISYEEVLSQPRKSFPVTLECAENPVGGGLVGHAEWTGASLAGLLEKAQPRSETRFVRLVGADEFARSIPLAKALHADTLIAHSMNGEKLLGVHGFPLRAVIPGWYGMDSIKWLRRIEVLAAEDNSRFMSQSYVRLRRSLLAGVRPDGAVTTMNVKAAFSRPVDGAILVGRKFTVRGAAWAGENRVRQVDVSTDAGKTWQTARLAPRPQPYAWVHWAYDWKIPGPGEYDLAVRATDEQGRQQPAERAPERVDDYELDVIQMVRVTVI